MNHLQEAKDMVENKKAYDGLEEIIAHALIAVAEGQQETLRKIGQIIEYGLPITLTPENTNALNKIAEQIIHPLEARIAELEAENARLKEKKDSILDNLNDWQNGYSKLLKETNRITDAYKAVIARLNPEEQEGINISP